MTGTFSLSFGEALGLNHPSRLHERGCARSPSHRVYKQLEKFWPYSGQKQGIFDGDLSKAGSFFDVQCVARFLGLRCDASSNVAQKGNT